MWTVATIKPNQTALAIINLNRQNYRTFNPVFETEKLHNNKLVTVQNPLFPFYLFIEIANGRRWAPINHTFGVSRLLTRPSQSDDYDEPCAVPSHFVERLMQCSHRNDERTWRLPIGATVRVRRGPFTLYEGVIASWSGKDRVRVLLHLLGRDNVTVEVLAADVVAIP